MSTRRRVKNVQFDEEDYDDYDDDYDDEYSVGEDDEEIVPVKAPPQTKKSAAPQRGVPPVKSANQPNSKRTESSLAGARAQRTADTGKAPGVSPSRKESPALPSAPCKKDVASRAAEPNPAPLAPAALSPESSEAAQAAAEARKQICVVTVGHVDAGKSSLVGQLLWQGGAVDASSLRRLQLQQQALGGKASRAASVFTWLLDEGREERERGVTVDLSSRSVAGETADVVFQDAPGHRDFVSSLIQGAALASVGLWVVDGFRLPLSDEEQDPSAADLEAFAVACSAEHLVLLRALDVTHLVVAVSRQDEARWDERRFNRLRQVLLRCTRVFGGFPSSNVSFVPVAALPGVNLIPQTRAEEQSRKLAAAAEARQSAKSESGLEQLIRLQEQQREQHRLMSKWWTGPSLLEAIEKLPDEATQRGCLQGGADSPKEALAACVADAFSSGGASRGKQDAQQSICMSFRVVRGNLSVGDSVLLMPSMQPLKCLAIHCGTLGYVKHCRAGAFVERGVFAASDIEAAESAAESGAVLCAPLKPLPVTTSIRARLLVLDEEMPVLPGRLVEVYVHCARTEGSVVGILPEEKNDTSDGSSTIKRQNKRGPRLLTRGEKGLVNIRLTDPICLLPHSANIRPTILSRIILRDTGRTVAAGVICQCD